jgi:hypothetical protein
MKQLLLLCTVFLSFISTNAQENETEKSKWSFAVQPKLGFAKYEETGSVTLNGTMTGFDFLLTRKIGNTFDLTSGLIIATFDGNRAQAGNEIRLQNDYVQIPLLIGGHINFGEKNDASPFKMRVAIGPTANFLARQYVETTGPHIKDENVGWNFSLMSQLSFEFKVSSKAALSLGLQGQSDLNRIDNDGSENKLQQVSAIVFGYRSQF